MIFQTVCAVIRYKCTKTHNSSQWHDMTHWKQQNTDIHDDNFCSTSLKCQLSGGVRILTRHLKHRQTDRQKLKYSCVPFTNECWHLTEFAQSFVPSFTEVHGQPSWAVNASVWCALDHSPLISHNNVISCFSIHAIFTLTYFTQRSQELWVTGWIDSHVHHNVTQRPTYCSTVDVRHQLA